MEKRFRVFCLSVCLSISIAIALVDPVAQADVITCDKMVSRLQTTHLGAMTLCELQTRYKTAIQRLKQAGIQNPLHIGNVMGPRFINMPDWIKYLAKNGDSEFAAWKVYDPSPRTWGNWMRAADVIDDEKTENVFLEKKPKIFRRGFYNCM
jgi:hypothetical protein